MPNYCTDDEIATAVRDSKSANQALICLNRACAGPAYTWLAQQVERLTLSTAHWTRKGIRGVQRSLANVLIENSPIRMRPCFKKRILQDGLLEYKCAICGISVWRNAPLVLRLDHINGIRNDHRIENLRLLCPNCDSQTETFCGRNHRAGIEVVRHCIDCNIPVTKGRLRCTNCAATHRLSAQKTKISWPTIEDLQALVGLYQGNLSAVSRQLGVSLTSVRKHIRRHSVIGNAGSFNLPSNGGSSPSGGAKGDV